MTSLVLRVAARYKSKKKLESGNVLYQYSERQVARRNKQKAERLEKLRKSVHKLRARVKKDLQSKDPETVLIALAVGLMDHTAERVGNEESKEERGHVGVTGWQKSHVSFSKGKATIKYTGKSGVKQKKEVSEKALVSALRKAHEACKEGDLFCHEGGKITAAKVNEYLKEFDITAKDLRGLHANSRMQENLKSVRSKGGELPSDAKERKAQLKKEFKKALEITAEDVGHEPSTLRSQYLVPGLEEEFMKGRVMSKMVKTALLTADAGARELEGWKADLRRMTKIYKSVPSAEEDKQLELFREARQLFIGFRDSFQEWIYQRLLPPLDKDTQTWFDKEVREKAWSAIAALSDLFPRQWSSRTDLHEDAPWELKRRIETNVRRYQRAFVDAFKAVESYLADEKAKGRTPESRPQRFEKHLVAGIHVLIDSFGRDEDRDLERDIEDFLSRLGTFAKRIAAAGFGKALEGLTVRVAFADSKTTQSPGLTAGQYNAPNDVLEIFPLGFIRSDGGTFTHEVGHRYWFKRLPPQAKARWKEMFDASTQTITAADVEDFVSNYLAKHTKLWKEDLEKVVKRQEDDPVTQAKFLELISFSRPMGIEREDIQGLRKWLLDAGVGTKVHVEKITDYATENELESFAEAFRLYIVEGPGALGPWTRWFFKEISRAGGAKLASMVVRVAARYLEARGKAKGLSLLPDFDKAVEKLETGDNGPILEFAEHLVNVIRESASKDWIAGLSVQKVNAINRLGRAAQFLSNVHWDTVKEHPALLASTVRDVKEWRKAIRTLELASTLGDEALEIKRGPFTVVPIPGLSKTDMEGALEALDAATLKLQAKCPKVLYGKVFFSKHIQKGTSARYFDDKDALALNVLAKKRFDDIFTIIHELGHRHQYKFLSKEGQTKYWDLSTRKVYEKIHFDAKLREQVADEAVQLAKLKAMGKALPAPSESLIWWLKSPHPHQKGDVRKLTSQYLEGKLDEKELHDAVKGNQDESVMTDKILHGPLHVTPYGATKPGENYADGFAHFVLGMDMPAELAAILADELK